MRLPQAYSAGSISTPAVRTGFQRQNAPYRILERLRGIQEPRSERETPTELVAINPQTVHETESDRLNVLPATLDRPKIGLKFHGMR